MRRQRLVLSPDGQEQETLVHEVYARGTQEFLDGLNPTSKAQLHIRLDRIEKVFDPLAN